MPSSKPPLVLTPLPGGGELGLVDALVQLAFVVHTTLGRVAAAHDMSVVQARLLAILRDRRPTIKELAAFLQLDKSSVTGLVDRAEERGLVRRTASVLDRRSVQVVITASGRKLVAQAASIFKADIDALVAHLSPAQRDQMSDLASQVVIADAHQRGMDLFDLVTKPR